MNNQFNKKPLVSIIMNCFNGAVYLNESIKSVLSQTYDNWELIFWDNQSIDTSAKIFQSYKDKRLLYFYAKEHTTLYKARNLAIEKSRGDYIAFLDTDDLWDKTKLELQLPHFNDPEVGVVFSNFWLIKENLKKKKLYMNKKLPRGSIYNELINYYSVGILTTIIRKEFYLKLKKRFDERFSIVGDFDLFLRLSKICLFESIQKPLAFYRLHSKNLLTQSKGKEIEEIEIWLRENQSNLSQSQTKKLQKDIDFRKFLNFKIYGKYKKCVYILLNSAINPFNIKNLIIFFTPVAILKKLLWFYKV